MVARRVLLGTGLALAGATARGAAAQVAGPEAAAPLRLLSGGALEPAVAAALALWRAAGEAAPAVTFATAPRIAERLAAGQRFDLVLAPATLVEGLRAAGGLAAPPVPLGAVGVGIALRAGAALPEIADEAGFRRTVLAAETLVFNRASTGLYVEALLARLGLAEQLAARSLRFPDGEAVLQRIAAGSGREIAFAAITEILLFRDRGVHFAGPLPAGLQNRTAYAAGLPLGAAAGAPRLAAFLDGAPARAAMAAAGVE